MSKDHRVDYSVEDRTAYIALNRPPVNAIDHAMIDAIHAGLRRADADASELRRIGTGHRQGGACASLAGGDTRWCGDRRCGALHLGRDGTPAPSRPLRVAGARCVPGAARRLAAPISDLAAGTAAEADGEVGTAHLVEHLWFRSQPTGGADLFTLGAGLALDGVTTADDTVYSTVGPAADLEALLAIEAARLRDPLQGIGEVELASEQRIIRD